MGKPDINIVIFNILTRQIKKLRSVCSTDCLSSCQHMRSAACPWVPSFCPFTSVARCQFYQWLFQSKFVLFKQFHYSVKLLQQFRASTRRTTFILQHIIFISYNFFSNLNGCSLWQSKHFPDGAIWIDRVNRLLASSQSWKALQSPSDLFALSLVCGCQSQSRLLLVGQLLMLIQFSAQAPTVLLFKLCLTL